jgi:hypothetical protein
MSNMLQDFFYYYNDEVMDASPDAIAAFQDLEVMVSGLESLVQELVIARDEVEEARDDKEQFEDTFSAALDELRQKFYDYQVVPECDPHVYDCENDCVFDEIRSLLEDLNEAAACADEDYPHKKLCSALIRVAEYEEDFETKISDAREKIDEIDELSNSGIDVEQLNDIIDLIELEGE